ncbi:MAG: tetratricopeptide repeat protein [Betaproteobacteria bacterium]|nr:tetratricopeptide repeat protein [Betaproteobacteria bacterium]
MAALLSVSGKQGEGSEAVTLVTHKYTPAGMSDRELLATFAAREHTVEYLLKSLRDQITAGTPSSFVVTGPRGAGKSTLIRLVALRIREDPVLSAAWIPIVFPEEQFNVYSLRDLLATTLEMLAKENLAGAKDWLASVAGEANDEQSLQLAITGLKEITRTQGRRLILFVENIHLWLEQSLDAKTKGTLRRLLMNEPFLMLVGSAIRVLDSLKNYDEALFNYLGEVRLDRLDTDQVFELLRRRAVFDGNDALLRDFPSQRAKVRAIAQLSGGNPRLTLMLYELLSHLQTSTVVQYLRRLVDELTPLFKHEIENLPPQQRKIIHALMERGGTAKPTDLVAPTRLRLNAITTQLKRLRDAQFVEVSGGGKGRAAYYSTPDRLFGIWYQMRYLNQNRRRIEVLVEALRIWFEEDERLLALKNLAERDRGAAPHVLRDASTTAEYLAVSLRGTQYAIQATESSIELWARTDLKEAAAVLADVVAYREGAETIDERLAHSQLAKWLIDHGDHARAIQALDSYVSSGPSDVMGFAEALISRGLAKAHLGDIEGEIADYTDAIGLTGAPKQQVARALFRRGNAKRQRGDFTSAIADYTSAIELDGANKADVAQALILRGVTKQQLGDLGGEVADYSTAIELKGTRTEDVVRATILRGVARNRHGDIEQSIADFTAAIERQGAPDELVAQVLNLRALAKEQRGDGDGAIDDYTATIRLVGATNRLAAEALLSRGSAKGRRGDIDGEIADYSAAIARPNAPKELVARALIARGITKGKRRDFDGAMADHSAVIDLEGAPQELVAQAFIARGVTKGKRRDFEPAIADYTTVIGLASTPKDLVAKAFALRATLNIQRGDFEGAIADYTASIEAEGAPKEAAVPALILRGLAKGEYGDTNGAIADYTTALELEGAPTERTAEALILRSFEKGNRGDAMGEIADWSTAIALENASKELLARAYIGRAIKRHQRGEFERAIGDYTAAIELEDAPSEDVAIALLGRGVTKEHRGDVEGAIADFTAAVELEGAPKVQVAKGLFNRGATKQQHGDVEGAITDYTSIIDLEGAPSEQVAMALFNRSVSKQQRGNVESAVADYTKILAIELRDYELISDAASAAFETVSQDSRGDAVLLAFVSSLARAPLAVATETAIRLLNKIAISKLKGAWPKAWRFLSTNLPSEVRNSLRIFEPVCTVLETGNEAQLAALPPEQRDFVESVLRRFDVIKQS